mmetsp:Transcript_40311/g.88137  ORF Transcript_40311/g.88137 Transcript_40311/m.88137 type:complete len:490 (+) Transcript_40311:41-1510(+)
MMKLWHTKRCVAPEWDCLHCVAQLQKQVQSEGDLFSPENKDTSIALLQALETLAGAMKVDVADRSYRSNFSRNYRNILPDAGRCYRVEVLEAAISNTAEIWVNGSKFEFSDEVVSYAHELQLQWFTLSEEIQQWSRLKGDIMLPGDIIGGLRCTLRKLDMAWATFERTYITELIKIEAAARKILVQSIAKERKLQVMEELFQSGFRSPVYWEAAFDNLQAILVRCISQLNASANSQGKGRSDLHVGILMAAKAVLEQRNHDCRDRGGARSVAALLAAGVQDSFHAMRLHLREVAHCVERVDPQLCNNPVLVEHLLAWERSWELGLRYLLKPELLTCLEDLAAEVLAAQRLLPELQGMCEDSDVEFFLILPRLLWLRFLSEPLKQKELIRSLLPQHFTLDDAHNDELEGLRERFCEVEKAHSGCRSALWEALVRRAVRGVCCKGLQAQPGSLAQAMDNLMRDLEGWSIKLQRQNPEDWNQCCHIIMQALL